MTKAVSDTDRLYATTCLGRDSFDEIRNGEAVRGLRASFKKGEMKGRVEKACESHVDYFGISRSLPLTAKEKA